MIVFAIAMSVQMIIYIILNKPQPVGIPDQTGSENINVMLTCPNNWKKIIDTPVISKKDMAILDGSTATIPITAELFRQFFDYYDSQIEQNSIVHHSITHNAYLALIDKGYKTESSYTTSLIFVTPPSDEEQQYANANCIELDLTPIAKDGFLCL